MKMNSLKKGKMIIFALMALLLAANLLMGCSGKKDTKTKDNVEIGKDMKTEKETTATDTSNSKVDKSGDYIGDIANPNPPEDDSYRIHNQADSNQCLVLRVTNIDNANIKFYFTIATNKEGTESDNHKDYYSEEIIFKEHIAHYNGDGYYEYIGKDYHIFLKYSSGVERDMGDYTMEVYGLGNLVNQSQYQIEEIPSYNGVDGIRLIRGLPFAG